MGPSNMQRDGKQRQGGPRGAKKVELGLAGQGEWQDRPGAKGQDWAVIVLISQAWLAGFFSLM